MKNLTKCVVVVFALFLASTTAFTQEWTKAQKEVWQVVEDSWAKMKAGDVDAVLAYIHEKYQGWNAEFSLPVTKEMAKRSFTEMKAAAQKFDYMLNPARIVVTDNAAVVHYYFGFQQTNVSEDKKETIQSYRGKNTEFYVKEGGKWLLLGDMTVLDKSKE